MINTNAKTRTDFQLSEDGMSLTLAMPAAPYRMPHTGGGHIVLMGYEGDGASNACSATPASASCGCGTCDTKPKPSGCTSSGKSSQNKLIDRFEVIKYSGYEGDGVTLILEKRGVEGTRPQNWLAGTIVLQTMTGADFKELDDRIKALEAHH